MSGRGAKKACKYRCKYCGAIYLDRKEFIKHKRFNHVQEMSLLGSETSSDRAPGTSPLTPSVSLPGSSVSSSASSSNEETIKTTCRPAETASAVSPETTATEPGAHSTKDQSVAPAATDVTRNTQNGPLASNSSPKPTTPRRSRMKPRKPKWPKNMPLPFGMQVSGKGTKEWIRNPKLTGG